MNILARLKISTKILVLLLMLGAVTIAIAFMGSRELRTVDAAYSAMVNEGKATLLMARANRRVTEMVFASTRAMAYDGASKEAKAADIAELAAYNSTQELFDQARLVTVLCRCLISLCHLGFECERADAAQI